MYVFGFPPCCYFDVRFIRFFFFLFKRNTKPRVTGVNPKTQIGIYLLLVGACSWVNYKLSAA